MATPSDKERVRRVEILDNGSHVLIEETPWATLSVDGAVETHTLDISDKQWEKVRQADRTTHDVVLDKATKSLTLKLKRKGSKS